MTVADELRLLAHEAGLVWDERTTVFGGQEIFIEGPDELEVQIYLDALDRLAEIHLGRYTFDNVEGSVLLEFVKEVLSGRMTLSVKRFIGRSLMLSIHVRESKFQAYARLPSILSPLEAWEITLLSGRN